MTVTDHPRVDLGERTLLDVVSALVPVSGLSVVDVGCGNGDFARELAGIGATVLGVEPDPIQAGKNRAAVPCSGVTLVESGGEDLPLPSSAADGVFYMLSLHHVPLHLMDAALDEAVRTLKPGGFLCSVEPGLDGLYFDMMRPFHDETEVRIAAQAALARLAPRVTGHQYQRFTQVIRHGDFAAFTDLVLSRTFNDTRREDVERDAVRALFEQGRSEDGGYRFEMPMLVNFYRKPD